MIWFRATAAIVAATLPLPAIAQTAADAFECKLPYRPTMEAAAKLKVLNQGKPIDMLISTMTMVTLDPGTAKIFGQTPLSVFLMLSEPSNTSDPTTMTFTTKFARTPAVEKALIGAVKWKTACGLGSAICYRAIDPPGTGELHIRFDDTKEIGMHCEFAPRAEDLQ